MSFQKVQFRGVHDQRVIHLRTTLSDTLNRNDSDHNISLNRQRWIDRFSLRALGHLFKNIINAILGKQIKISLERMKIFHFFAVSALALSNLDSLREDKARANAILR